jgi:hypothetical protein
MRHGPSARRESRLALDEPARLAPNHWSNVEVRMLECTEARFRAAGDITVRVGSMVTLDVPGLGPVEAYVTWQRSGQFAATFAEPIDLARARFTSLNREVMLARLLVERAAAHAAGKNDRERSLKQQILDHLPVTQLVASPAGPSALRRQRRRIEH